MASVYFEKQFTCQRQIKRNMPPFCCFSWVFETAIGNFLPYKQKKYPELGVIMRGKRATCAAGGIDILTKKLRFRAGRLLYLGGW